ncbi:hypothetical protein ONE63_002508 [Megalurothrips usitatus]|uniref:Uncharacterized protein n=1 Tax=Megalurothrips usitatus TaxID=439358 RepID=A0AAV7XAP8_9NEOP|nr:hypothetical protein ONE63_002508 [Megalurothrips usitatus]
MTADGLNWTPLVCPGRARRPRPPTHLSGRRPCPPPLPYGAKRCAPLHLAACMCVCDVRLHLLPPRLRSKDCVAAAARMTAGSQMCRPHHFPPSPLHPWLSSTSDAASSAKPASSSSAEQHNNPSTTPTNNPSTTPTNTSNNNNNNSTSNNNNNNNNNRTEPAEDQKPSSPSVSSHHGGGVPQHHHLFSFPPTPPKDATPDSVTAASTAASASNEYNAAIAQAAHAAAMGAAFMQQHQDVSGCDVKPTMLGSSCANATSSSNKQREGTASSAFSCSSAATSPVDDPAPSSSPTRRQDQDCGMDQQQAQHMQDSGGHYPPPPLQYGGQGGGYMGYPHHLNHHMFGAKTSPSPLGGLGSSKVSSRNKSRSSAGKEGLVDTPWCRCICLPAPDLTHRAWPGAGACGRGPCGTPAGAGTRAAHERIACGTNSNLFWCWFWLGSLSLALPPPLSPARVGSSAGLPQPWACVHACVCVCLHVCVCVCTYLTVSKHPCASITSGTHQII